VDGSTYADEISEEVAALWKLVAVDASSVSGTNALTMALTVPLASLEAGNTITFVAPSTNTGAVYLNVYNLGSKEVKSSGGDALTAGQLVSGVSYLIRYDGTDWLMTPDTLSLGPLIEALTAKSTPVGADLMVISDSEDSDAPKKLTLTQLSAAIAPATAIELLARADFAGESSAQFTAFDPTKYGGYLFTLEGVTGSTTGITLFARYSYDGGSSWSTTSNSYSHVSVGAEVNVDGSVNSLIAGNRLDNVISLAVISTPAANGGLSGTLYLFEPEKAAKTTLFGVLAVPGSYPTIAQVSGQQTTTDEVDGLQFSPSGGTLASGAISMYGIRKEV
jgi:hypothetical protein